MRRDERGTMLFETSEVFHAERLSNDEVLDRATDIIRVCSGTGAYQSVSAAHGARCSSYKEAYRICDTGSLCIRVQPAMTPHYLELRVEGAS